VNKQAPWPSCQITFSRLPRRPRKQNKWPLRDRAARSPGPAEPATGSPCAYRCGPVASHTRTPVGSGIIAVVAHRTRPATLPSLSPRRPAPAIRIRARSQTRSRSHRCWPILRRYRLLGLRDHRGRPRNRFVVHQRHSCSARNDRRHFRSNERETPYRRAVADTCRGPCRLSSTILSFSSRTSAAAGPSPPLRAARFGHLCLSLSIRTVLNIRDHLARRLPTGGLH